MSNPFVSMAALAEWDQLYASLRESVDALVEANRNCTADDISRVESLIAGSRVMARNYSPPRLADLLSTAVAMLVDAQDAASQADTQGRYAVRYLTAYRSARQRADAVHQALVEADEERDYLRAQLRDSQADVRHYQSLLAGEFGSDR